MKVLEKNFSNTTKYANIYDTDFTRYRGHIDILTGGFPCQPFSNAGKRRGNQDDRYLWPEMLRAIREIAPEYVVAENVPGLLTIDGGMVFEQVCSDLEAEGYQIQAYSIPACAVGAPHQRERIWIVANSHSARQLQQERRIGEIGQWISNSDTHVADTGSERMFDGTPEVEESDTHEEYDTTRTGRKLTELHWAECNHSTSANAYARRHRRHQSARLRARATALGSWSRHWDEVATELCRVDDGLPNRMDKLRALGNAIVPEVAYRIFQSIFNKQ